MFCLICFSFSWSSVNTVGEKSPSSSHAIVCWHRITTLMIIPLKAPQFTLLRSTTGIWRGSTSTLKKEPYKSRDLQVGLLIWILLSCTESIKKFWVYHHECCYPCLDYWNFHLERLFRLNVADMKNLWHGVKRFFLQLMRQWREMNSGIMTNKLI